MDDFGINEMLEMQKALQDKYKDIWEKISPEIGQNKLLWMIGEIGEVIDIIKKYGGETACEDEKLRACLFFASAFWRKVQNFLENIASPKWRKVQTVSKR